MKQFLYEDEAAATPPSPTGLPDGYAMFTNDGVLHVIRSGAWVAIKPFVFLDDTISVAPSPAGLPDGYALFTDDGRLHVIRSGAFVTLNPDSVVTTAAFTADHTLADADTGKVLEGGAAMDFLIPTGLVEGFIVQVDQTAAGAVTVTPDTGTTLNGATATVTLTAQWSTVSVRQLDGSPDDYIIVGQFA